VKRSEATMKLGPPTVAFGLFAYVAPMSESLAETASEQFMVVQHGQLPIVISAPHGGTMLLPGVAARQNHGDHQFNIGRDVRTLELAQKLAAAIELKLGHAPFTVIAKFERKHIDANRPAVYAYDPPGAGGPKSVYDAYHRALTDARAQVQSMFGRGLLLDVHGQSREGDAIFRGTQNDRTVAHLVRRSGEAAVRGPKSIFGVLAASGYRVLPPLVAGAREDQLEGGYTVMTYGSMRGGNVDAIQLEFGHHLRTPASIDKTANDAAEAVATFAKAYLPAGKSDQ
jgi:N-formylglutamate amidohydrolase